jgi:hypothetical protein
MLGQPAPVWAMVTTTLPPDSVEEICTEVISTTDPQLSDEPLADWDAPVLSVSLPEAVVWVVPVADAPAGALVSMTNNPDIAATRPSTRSAKSFRPIPSWTD